MECRRPSGWFRETVLPREPPQLPLRKGKEGSYDQGGALRALLLRPTEEGLSGLCSSRA